MNTTQVDNYVAAMKSYLAVIVEVPTQADKDIMRIKLDLFDTAEGKFIESFYGLGDMNFAFSIEPKNAEFNTKRTQSSAVKTNLRNNPDQSYSFFSDPATATKFADYNVAAIDTSNRIKSGK
jgi:hypothetical protein